VQVKNVPARLRQQLRRYARRDGRTIGDLAPAAIEREMARRAWLERLSRRPRTDPGIAVPTVQADLDSCQSAFSNDLMRRLLLLLVSLVFALAGSPAGWARLIGVETNQRAELLGGRSFGLAGAYEKITGKIRFAADPSNPANRIITDIDLAPRNENGEVEFAADFYLLKPKDVRRGNGAVLLEIGNRGRKGMLSFFNFAEGSLDPSEQMHFGDHFLLERGYTLLWVGWQFDVPQREGLMRAYVPHAAKNGEPIEGLVRSNFVVARSTEFHSLADRNHIPYPAAGPKDPRNRMTVRRRATDQPQEIPRERWRFARFEDGKTIADPGHVWLEGGFEPRRIYEVVYISENPPVVGLGSAAVRDAVSQLKYGGLADWSIPAETIDRAYAFGISQSGRFLRTFLYYGFNRDEQDRKVFDGVLSHVAGAGRGSFNHRFAQPSRDAHPYMNFFYPTDIFPFTGIEQTDPVSGLSGGLLTRSLKPEWMPKVFYTNSAYEYWGRAASLIHTTVDGKADAPAMPNVRIYAFAGTQHGPADFPPQRTIGQQLSNPLDFRWSMRALLDAMDRWVTAGEEPPPSRHGRLAGGTLTPPEKLDFPNIPGVNFSPRIHKAYRLDFGPRFYSEGIITIEPPKAGPAFPMFVFTVDEDGNETAGVQMPALAVPLATYTGWNLFHEDAGPPDEISSMAGSYIPFPSTRRQRIESGDPRLSVEERYPSRDAYLGKLAAAAINMAKEGYLLDEDVPELVEQGARHWDHVMEDRRENK